MALGGDPGLGSLGEEDNTILEVWVFQDRREGRHLTPVTLVQGLHKSSPVLWHQGWLPGWLPRPFPTLLHPDCNLSILGHPLP